MKHLSMDEYIRTIENIPDGASSLFLGAGASIQSGVPSAGLGRLDKVLNVLGREDLLDFGTGKRIKKIKTAKWDTARNTIDYHSIIPQI